MTPDAVSAVLADFQAWLTALPATAEDLDSSSAEEFIDLHTLLAQFLAVRQEVNLQTRAARAQQEQNAEALKQLTTALEALRQSQKNADETREKAVEEAIDAAVRPLLKSLVDVYDGVALASREMQRLRDTVLPNLEDLAAATEVDEPEPEPEPEPEVAPAPPPSWWQRWFGAPTQSPTPVPAPSKPDKPSSEQRERERLARESAERVRSLLSSLVMGYTMSLQRIERTLRQHDLDAIPTVGERFDPEQMEVVEAVANSGRPTGEVLEEVRRGYLWNGRVFRYAQVRVAKG